MPSYGKHLISTQDWELNELYNVIHLAAQMKQDRFNPKWKEVLKDKTFIMLFHNQSLRTHLSFEIAANELGGHAIYRHQNMGWIKSSKKNISGESIKDAIKVISRYAHGLGIRLTLDAITQYGEGNEILREYSRWSDIPIINMADDMFHPCQGLADIMGWAEWYGMGRGKPELENLKGKKLLLTWARSGLARPWSSVQSHLLLAAQFGMHITLAHPRGYELDPDVFAITQDYCKKNQTDFIVTHDPDAGYQGAHVVYARNWITDNAYNDGELNYKNEVEKALANKEWMVTAKRMQETESAIFANPMPVDRNIEAEESVIDNERSIIYEVAENRLHIQKAIMAVTMGNWQ